eukprot:4640748-Amphidinium_carterae.1
MVTCAGMSVARPSVAFAQALVYYYRMLGKQISDMEQQEGLPRPSWHVLRPSKSCWDRERGAHFCVLCSFCPTAGFMACAAVAAP